MSAPPILVILDLNGILVERLTRDELAARAVSAAQREASTALGQGMRLFLRPGCAAFLDYLLAHFAVGVWSSMKRDNVDKVVAALLRDRAPQLLVRLDRSHCVERPSPGKPWDSLKPLERVFENLPTDLLRARFTAATTLVIDDSCLKACFNATNVFCPPPFVVGADSDDDRVLADVVRPMLDAVLAAHAAHAAAAAKCVPPAPPALPFDVRAVLAPMPLCAKPLIAEFERAHPKFVHTPPSSPAPRASPSPSPSPKPKASSSPAPAATGARRKLVLEPAAGVFVGGIDRDAADAEQQLKSLLATCGDVASLALKRKPSGDSFAFVHMATPDAAAAAIGALNGAQLGAKSLRASPLKPADEPRRGKTGARRPLATSGDLGGAADTAVASASSSQSEGNAVAGVRVVQVKHR